MKNNNKKLKYFGYELKRNKDKDIDKNFNKANKFLDDVCNKKNVNEKKLNKMLDYFSAFIKKENSLLIYQRVVAKLLTELAESKGEDIAKILIEDIFNASGFRVAVKRIKIEKNIKNKVNK